MFFLISLLIIPSAVVAVSQQMIGMMLENTFKCDPVAPFTSKLTMQPQNHILYRFQLHIWKCS